MGVCNHLKRGRFEGQAVVVSIILVIKILEILQCTQILLTILDQTEGERRESEK